MRISVMRKRCVHAQEEAETCGKCGKEVKGESLGVGEHCYHASCLTCTTCKQNLAGQPVSLDQSGNIYCTRDYDRSYNNIQLTPILN